jgi:hypothetical protein
MDILWRRRKGQKSDLVAELMASIRRNGIPVFHHLQCNTATVVSLYDGAAGLG